MTERGQIEIIIKEKLNKLELNTSYCNYIINLLSQTDKSNEDKRINFNYSKSYFLYKEREKLLSEINLLLSIIGKSKIYTNDLNFGINESAFLKNEEKTFFIETFGGLGDCLLMTPAFKSIKKNNPKAHIKLKYNQPIHMDILKKNPYIDGILENQEYQENLCNIIQIDVYNVFPSLIYPKKISQIICELLRTEFIDDRLELYLNEDEIHFGKSYVKRYSNVVCINPTSVCSKNQEWPIKHWEELIDKGLKMGFKFIQIGLNDETFIKGCIDLRGQFSLRENLAILNAANGYIGVDSFWAHAASALNIPAIVLFGDSTPEIWGHENNVNIYKKYECSPCFEILYGQDCPYNKKCMNDISVNDVLESFRYFKKSK